MDKPELLAPAGNLKKLKIAVKYGADAVYIGGEEFSLRMAADNFSFEDMRRGVDFAHSNGKKVYVTANIIPHNDDIREYPAFLRKAVAAEVDAVILSDLGMLDITREIAPDIDVHVSTQANNVNFYSAKMWHKLGAKRIILARELSLSEIAQIKREIPPDLELECFVHGAMCISYSGRCLLSNYMINRDANRGECAQPCRWKYFLMEERRPGEYMPVFENERGTFIYNGKDLCVINHIDQLIAAGIGSFKIEGRVKSEYYVATVVKAYREAIDRYFEDPEHFTPDPAWMEELRKVSHRGYTTGFFFAKPGGEEQNYESSSYIREYELAGMIEGYDPETGMADVRQKNRFFRGDEVEILSPCGKFFTQTVEFMTDENGAEIERANKPQSLVKLRVTQPVEVDGMLRRRHERLSDGGV